MYIHHAYKYAHRLHNYTYMHKYTCFLSRIHVSYAQTKHVIYTNKHMTDVSMHTIYTDAHHLR